MTPTCSSSRTRRQQGEGETPTAPARSTLEMRAFSCSTDRMRRSMASSDGFSGKAEFSPVVAKEGRRSEEHTSELQSLMRISYAVFCLKKKTTTKSQIKSKI